MQILHKLVYKVLENFSLEFGRLATHGTMDNGIYYSVYSRHSSLAQLFGEDSDGFRSGLDDDGSDMEICGGVLSWGFSGWKGLIFLI
jgi:hypothetical protein